MSLYATTFAEFATGTGTPTGWVEPWDIAADWSIVELTGGDATSRVVRKAVGANFDLLALSDVSFDLAAGVSAEILAKKRLIAGADAALYFFAHVGATSFSGWEVGIAGANARIGRLDNGTFSSRATAAHGLTTTNWYWIRARIAGGVIYLRTWADGASEPSTWTLQYTIPGGDAGLAYAGKLGVFAYSTGNLFECDYFEARSAADVDRVVSRGLTVAMQTAIAREASPTAYLFALTFTGGILRYSTLAHDLSWSGYTWVGIGGVLEFTQVEESTDLAAARTQLKISGVDQTILAAVLTDGAIAGRTVELYLASFDPTTGALVDAPFKFFRGLFSGWEIRESPPSPASAGTVEITAHCVSRVADLDQQRGIQTNLASHGALYPGDQFFGYVDQLAKRKIVWRKP